MANSLPKSIREAITKCPRIIGIGPSAWPRIIPSFFFPKFEIISYYDCQDNDFIARSGVKIFSLKKANPYLEISPVTPGNILNTQEAQKYLSNIREDFVFLVYKSFSKLEKLCDEHGWRFIGNKKELVDTYENKKLFKETLRKIGIEPIPGDNIRVEELTKASFAKYQKAFNQDRLVLQLAEMTYGGGSGTLFIDKAKDLTPFFGRVAKIRHKLEGKKKKIETVNITPFIEGISCSVPCCATKFGTFTGAIQNQIIDIAEVGAVIPGRSGNFAGHDWAYRHFSPDVQHKANQIARQFGDYLYSRGYKGIFGLDLIVDNDNKVWPVECNPRETDAFPLICMLQMEAGAIPMTVFHILEHLSVDYTVPFEETDLSYKNAYSAAQIILYNKFDIPVTDSKLFKAGVYANSDGKLRYLRPGYTLFDLLNTKEFLMTEAITKKTGLAYKPHERIMRLVKRGGILASAGGLEVDVAKSIDLIYKELKFIPIDTGFVDQSGVKTLFANRLIDVKSDPNLAKAKVVNLINDYASGFRRPMKIAWRKHITKSSILEQIKSKRAQKQIKSDIKKIANLGIRIEVIPEIDQAMFAKWFAVYNKMIKAKKYGKLVIDKDWLKAKQKAGRKVGAVVAFKKEKILGGEVFFEVAGRLTVGYGAAAKISELAGGLTLLLDYYFLDYASRQGYDEVSFGQDTNLYGTDLSIGLLAYKVKLGLTPVKANKTYSVTTYFLNFDDFDDPIMFFADKPGGLELTVIAKDQSTTDFKAYLPQNIKECKIFFSSEVVEQNKELF